MSWIDRTDATSTVRKRRHSEEDDGVFHPDTARPIIDTKTIPDKNISLDARKKVTRQMIESAQKYLDKQDANMFFAYPVTDDIAPLYSQIIASPMDFSTMKNNIIRGVYTSIEQYKAHAILVFDNCMRYNSPDTIFYQEAKRIKDLASIYFAREEKIFFDEVDKESKRLTKPQLPISSFSTKRPKAEGPTLMIPHHEPTTVVTAPFYHHTALSMP